MRPIRCFILLLRLLVINAELTLESVYQKVNDLEVEMTALKVFNIKGYHKVGYHKVERTGSIGLNPKNC